MNESGFRSYLAFLRGLSETLGELSRVEQEKTQAVRGDDLDGLNACMKQEQAITMTLRSYDQKRERMLSELGLQGVTLRALISRAPDACRDEAKGAVEELCRQFALFRGAAEVARDTLECNLHQIEKLMADAGDTSGFPGAEPEMPSSLRTDFRA